MNDQRLTVINDLAKIKSESPPVETGGLSNQKPLTIKPYPMKIREQDKRQRILGCRIYSILIIKKSTAIIFKRNKAADQQNFFILLTTASVFRCFE